MNEILTINIDGRLFFLFMLLAAGLFYYLILTINVWLENLEHKKARGKDLIFDSKNHLWNFVKFTIAKAYIKYLNK